MARMDREYVGKYIEPRLKILRHPGVLQKLRSGQHVYPLNVEMDLSDACNLKCNWCAFAHLRNPDQMSPALAWEILHQLAMVGVKSVTFSGGGEPTTNPHFPTIAWNAKSLEFDLGLYTNGVDIDRLMECLPAFKWIYVSLDEIRPEAYRKAKWRDCLDQVIDNVRKLVAAKEDTVLGLGFLIHKDNIDDIGNMVRLGHTLGVDYVQFRPVVGLADYGWSPRALEILDQMRDDWGDFVIVARERFNELAAQRRGEWERGYDVCRGSELVPCIGANGTLWVCPNTRGIEDRSLGSLVDYSLAKLWKGRDTQYVDSDCRIACRNHNLNRTLQYICESGPHNGFV